MIATSADVVGIVAVNSTEFVEATLQCHADALVSVSLRDPSDRERIATAGVKRIVAPGRSTGWRRSSFVPSASDDVSQILFTSGTTGAGKGIALTRRNIADTTARLTAVMKLDGSVREYLGAPVYYSFGLFRCRVVSALGGEYFIPAAGFDPSEIGAMLRRGEINALSAVPSQWRVLLEHSELVAPAGRSMKWIEIGSQSMSRAEKEELKSLFPNAVIVQHYGLTEAPRTTFLRIHAEEGRALESVGRAEGGVELRIDEEGEIQIRGAHVAAHRLGPDGLVPLADFDGWLSTHDVGSIRDGLLYFEGRSDDLINCGGVKLFPEALEERMHRLLGSGAVVVSRTPDRMRGDGILVSYTPDVSASAERVRVAAVRAAETFGINAAGAIQLQVIEEIPRTETGKVRRQALIERFRGANGSSAAAGSLEHTIEQLWKEALGVDVIGPNSSFFELGGDPASASRLIPRMEAAGVGPAGLHGVLDGLTIAQIVALSETPAALLAAEPAPADPGAELERQISEIWRSALGRTDVATDQSFYDIGGDSLSAITVALQMERSGLDPALARGILAGKTIADLSREMSATAGAAPAAAPATAPAVAQVAAPRTPVAAPVATKTPLAALSESMNFVKGIVLLCMLTSHWLPVYITELAGDRATLLRRSFAPVYSLGSPTLAFVFGLGIPIFFLRQYGSSTTAFRRTLRTTGWLLAAGLLIGGLADIASALVRGAPVDAGTVALMLVGPFAYFLPATLSLPLWLKHLRNDTGGILKVFFVSLSLYLIYLAMRKVLLPGSDSKMVELIFRLLAGHWSLLQMGAISMFGVGVGLIIDRRIRSGKGIEDFLGYGLLMIHGGAIMSIAAYDFSSWILFPKNITLWSVFTYAGLALAMMAVFERVMERARHNRLARGLIELTCSLGIVLFPLYVIQSTVYHSSSILTALTGMPFARALTICIVVFLLVASYPVRRVYGLYYGRFWGTTAA